MAFVLDLNFNCLSSFLWLQFEIVRCSLPLKPLLLMTQIFHCHIPNAANSSSFGLLTTLVFLTTWSMWITWQWSRSFLTSQTSRLCSDLPSAWMILKWSSQRKWLALQSRHLPLTAWLHMTHLWEIGNAYLDTVISCFQAVSKEGAKSGFSLMVSLRNNNNC